MHVWWLLNSFTYLLTYFTSVHADADTATWTVTIFLLVLGRFLRHSYQSASTLQRLNVLHSYSKMLRRRGRAELANSSRTSSVVGHTSLWHCSNKSDSKRSSFIVERMTASVRCNFENTLSDSYVVTGSVPSMSSVECRTSPTADVVYWEYIFFILRDVMLQLAYRVTGDRCWHEVMVLRHIWALFSILCSVTEWRIVVLGSGNEVIDIRQPCEFVTLIPTITEG